MRHRKTMPAETAEELVAMGQKGMALCEEALALLDRDAVTDGTYATDHYRVRAWLRSGHAAFREMSAKTRSPKKERPRDADAASLRSLGFQATELSVGHARHAALLDLGPASEGGNGDEHSGGKRDPGQVGSDEGRQVTEQGGVKRGFHVERSSCVESWLLPMGTPRLWLTPRQAKNSETAVRRRRAQRAGLIS